MKKNLIISGGIFHPFEDSSKTLSTILDDIGYESLITMDIEEAFKNLEDYDLLTINALRWRMLNHEKYLPYIDEWAFSLSEDGRKHLDNYIKNGGSMIALHTSSICFDDWDGWSKVLGGKWNWDRSFHPPLGPIKVTPIANHFVTDNIQSFTLNDEVYHNLELEPESKPFLIGYTEETKEEHIIAWSYKYQQGRVIYNALGHDSDSLKNKELSEIIKRSALWVSGDSDA